MNLEGRKGRRLAVGAALLLLSTAVAVGIAGQDSSVKDRRSGPTLKASRSIAKSFSLFRSPPTGLPFSISTRLSPSSVGVSWALARELRKNIWAAPANDHICLLKRGPDQAIAVTCTRTARALSHGIYMASLRDPSMQEPGPGRQIVGLTPDNTSQVRLRTPGYPTVAVKVDHGVFVQRDNIPASPRTVTLLRD